MSTRRSKPKRKQGEQQRVVKDMDNQLKQLVLVQQEANRTSPPRNPDIPFPFLKRNKVFTFTRAFTNGTLVATSLADTNFAFTFTLNAFPDFADFTALFDQYRIGPCKVTFTPQGSVEAVLNTVIGTVIDYDDAVLVPMTGLQEYSTFQLNGLGRMFERVLQPRAANAAYSGVFTSFALMPPNTWVDVASPGVIYYGLKGQIPATTFTGGPYNVYSVQSTAILQFRNSR